MARKSDISGVFRRNGQLSAKSTAAAAWRAVVSKTGTGLSFSLTRSGISVQPRMTPLPQIAIAGSRAFDFEILTYARSRDILLSVRGRDIQGLWPALSAQAFKKSLAGLALAAEEQPSPLLRSSPTRRP
jgi:hypothetical protein